MPNTGGGGAGGGAGGGLPTPFPGDDRYVVGNDGVSTGLWKLLTTDDLGTPLSSTLVLNKATLVERGAELSEVSGTSTNTPGGTVTSASLATTYSGATDAGDVNLGTWTTNAPFTSATADGTVKRTAPGATDPIMTVTRTYSNGATTKTVTDTVRWTYKVFAGPSANTSLTEAQIEALTCTGYPALQTDIDGTYTMTLASQYGFIAVPNIAPWSSGTLVVTQGGFPSAWSVIGTVTVTNSEGVACSYQVIRTDGLLTGTLTFTVVRS